MPKYAYIFSGQGAQFAGMGRELYDNYSVCKDIFDKAEELCGFPLKSICFDADKAETLNDTRYCQAAIYAHSMAALEVVKERLGDAICTAGLSLGEYSALTYAGAMSLSQGVEFLKNRGAFMADACDVTDGAMSAVMGISYEDCMKACNEAADEAENEFVNVSNVNTIGQVVISGCAAAVARAEEACKKYGGKRAIRLPVSGAYHSVYMQSAADRLAEYLNSFSFGEMRMPVVSNVDGEVYADVSRIVGTLSRQVTASVLWADCVRKMAALGADCFVEIGPGKALSGFVAKVLPGAKVLTYTDVIEGQD